MRVIGRFLIYYRDNAKWLERTYDFVPRVGLEKLRDIIVERLARASATQLDAEVEKTAAAYVDPWLERDNPAFAGPVRGRTAGPAAGADVSVDRVPEMQSGRRKRPAGGELRHEPTTMSPRPAFRRRLRAGRPRRSGWAGRSASAGTRSPCSAPATGKVFAVAGTLPAQGRAARRRDARRRAGRLPAARLPLRRRDRRRATSPACARSRRTRSR